MFGCRKLVTQIYIVNASKARNQSWGKQYSHKIYRTLSTSNRKLKDKNEKSCDASKEFQKEKNAVETGSSSLAKIGKSDTTPTSDLKSYKPQIYDESCNRPYVDPCKNKYKQTEPCVPEQILSEPCRENKMPPKEVECKVDPDCPYPPGDDGSFMLNFKKALLLFGTGLATYIIYKNMTTPEKVEEMPVIVRKKRRCAGPVEITKDPISSSLIPSEIEYLLIGGGTAAFSAFRAIKSLDPKAKVLVITKEPYNPYMRPPLSKELYYQEDREAAQELKFRQWNGAERSLYFEPNEFYSPVEFIASAENGGVAVARGWEVKKLNVVKKQVALTDGKIIKYNKCLIATGGTPKNLPILEDAKSDIKDKVTLYRSILDFKEVEDVFSNCQPSNIAIIGGGFLGTELAMSLAKRGESTKTKITHIIRGPGPLVKILPVYLSKWAALKIKKEGVNVITDVEVDDISAEEDQLRILLSDDRNVIADHVVVALGVDPNIGFADNAGLEIDPRNGGYVVNPQMLARSDLYVAGDCASYYDEGLGRRRREEHHDNAVVTGRIAGENMTGKASHYETQSMFWSEMGAEMGFEAIGIVDASLPTVAVFTKSAGGTNTVSETPDNSDRPDRPDREQSEAAKEELLDESEYKKGIIFYLKNDIVVGIVLWNVFNKIGIARQLLKEKKNYKDLNDVAKLFSIHGGEQREAS